LGGVWRGGWEVGGERSGERVEIEGCGGEVSFEGMEGKGRQRAV